MRYIDAMLQPRRTHPFRRWRHPAERGGPSPFPRDVILALLESSTWKRHPAPFAKTRRGGLRRVERRFIAGRKCGFGCP